MFDAANHNLDAAELETAIDLNDIVEALSDGLDIGDAGPVIGGFTKIARRLQGMDRREIRRHLAKAAVAQVFDELTEEGLL